MVFNIERGVKMYYIKAHRGASSVLGGASSLLKREGVTREFTSKEEAQNEASRLNLTVPLMVSVWYTVSGYDSSEYDKWERG